MLRGDLADVANGQEGTLGRGQALDVEAKVRDSLLGLLTGSARGCAWGAGIRHYVA